MMKSTLTCNIWFVPPRTSPNLSSPLANTNFQLSGWLGNVMDPKSHFKGAKAHGQSDLWFEMSVLQQLLVKKRFLYQLELQLIATIAYTTPKSPAGLSHITLPRPRKVLCLPNIFIIPGH